MVRDGEVLGALILPPDLLDKLRSLTSLDPEQPTVEVLVNEDDPVKAQLVDDRIYALVTEANLILSQRISGPGRRLPRPADRGRHFSIPLLGETSTSSASHRAAEILEPDRARSCRRGPARDALDEVIRVRASSRSENLDFALPLLGAVAHADRGRQGGRLRRHRRRSTRSRSRSRRR